MIAILLASLAYTAPLPSQEIAAILTNESKGHLNELEILKNRIVLLQRQIEELHSKDASAKETFAKVVTQMKEKIAELANKIEQLAHPHVVILADDPHPNKTPCKPTPPPAPPKKECKPLCRNDLGVNLTGEWLYWKTVQEGMQYATSYNIIVGDMAQAHTHSVHFDFNSGFRLQADYKIPYDKWDLMGSYLQFDPEQSASVTGSLFPYLLYLGDLNIAPAPLVVNSASIDWDIHYKTWDLEMGRTFFTPAFALRPHAGVKEAWIRQNVRLAYLGTPLDSTLRSTVALKDKFTGAGIQGGLDSAWRLGAGFSLFGNFTGALLWGSYDLKQTQIIEGVPDIGWRDHFHAMAPMVDAKLGLGWRFTPCRSRFTFGIRGALEMQYWWNQNIIERFTSATNAISVKTTYDLAFYGLTLSASLGF